MCNKEQRLYVIEKVRQYKKWIGLGIFGTATKLILGLTIGFTFF